MADRITLYEVGPRDGLQNEARMIPAADKIALIDMLSQTGLRKIEATSFVSPKWVPQMADAADVMAGITRAPGVDYAVLTPNQRGLDAAIDAGATEVAVFLSASEGFSKANVNATIAESIARAEPLVEAGRRAGLRVRGYVSCITDCPYDGSVEPDAAARVSAALRGMGCAEISLGDTLGKAVPERLAPVLDAVLEVVPAEELAGHFHDTGGRALDNIELSIDRGLRVFDASVGGLGGCPYAPGAAGNVATEAVLKRVTDLGFETGVDPTALAHAAGFAKGLRSTGAAA